MSVSKGPIRVLIVDDSSLMRQLLTIVLSGDPEIEVVGAAEDPFVARDMIKELNPDVMTLDVEMPRMDGLSFLRKVMELRPLPVVMISSLTQANADVTIKALEIGAIDFVAKPKSDITTSMEGLSTELRTKIKAAALIKMRVRSAAPAAARPARVGSFGKTPKIAFVGASTGGVEALMKLLMGLPADCPPTLITQHMPERFTASFASRLNNECAMTVVEASHNRPVEAGHVYIAPGSHHLEIARSGGRLVCRVHDEPLVSGHRPSVDVLFRSAARVVGKNAVGVILTGMGKDGAEGLLEMRQAECITLGQDEASSLIYGMPKAAFERGAVSKQYPLGSMADAMLDACHDTKVKAHA
jgi:two-component system chemotaxis response regulator CheB